ncbi:MAG: hypothetical protein C0501_01820 [Isosphaera sp.]|nr:hypothetical protein [Isosphaera sp.]
MTRACLIGLALAAATPAPAADPARPNVVVIVADDLGYADVGFQGCKDIPTPHLDALAGGGVVCTGGYVSHPFCSPTRAGLMTGRYQHRFGHENNPAWLPDDKAVGLPLDQVTLADALKKAGYRTGAVGKWHLGAHPAFHPNRRGFDDYFGLLGGGHQYFDHNRFKTDPDRARQEYFIPLVRNEKPVEEAAYLTDALGREAAAFVEAHRKGPFFLYLAFNAPHTPLQAPEKYLARVKDLKDEKLRTYAAMVCGLDDAVGAVAAKLREHGLDRNTLIFFLSDNGGPVAVTNCRNTPLRGAKGQLYEGGVRVPFVVSWPDRLKPGRFDHPVSSLDIFPTALAAGGGEAPKGLDGVDLVPHLQGKAAGLADRTLFWRTGGGQSFAARKGPLKYVRVGKQPAELYDLAADAAEAADLAGKRPEAVAALGKELDAWNAALVEPRWQNPTPKKK